VSATGAYSSTSRTIVNVDLESGTTFGPEQMFEDDMKLARFLESRVSREAAARMRAAIHTTPEEAEMLQELAAGLPTPWRHWSRSRCSFG
jgi:hypothetical protein